MNTKSKISLLWSAIGYMIFKPANILPTKIHRLTIKVYDGSEINEVNARKWCRLLKEAALMCMTKNRVGVHLWARMIWKNNWMQNSGKQMIHSFWITRMFSKCISLSNPRICYGLVDRLGVGLFRRWHTWADPRWKVPWFTYRLHGEAV